MTRTHAQWSAKLHTSGLGHNDVVALLKDWQDEREYLVEKVRDAAAKLNALATCVEEQLPCTELPF